MTLRPPGAPAGRVSSSAVLWSFIRDVRGGISVRVSNFATVPIGRVAEPYETRMHNEALWCGSAAAP
jgi:hypothetical protein